MCDRTFLEQDAEKFAVRFNELATSRAARNYGISIVAGACTHLKAREFSDSRADLTVRSTTKQYCLMAIHRHRFR